jgi:hypothetical protein
VHSGGLFFPAALKKDRLLFLLLSLLGHKKSEQNQDGRESGR